MAKRKSTSAIAVIIAVLTALVCLFAVQFNAQAATYKKGELKVTSSDLRRPTVLKKGASFSISGKLTANKNIERVEVSVYDRNQFRNDTFYGKNISSKTVKLKDYDSKIKFGKLSSGEKQLRYTLTDADGNKIVIRRNFTVLGAAKEPKHMTSKCKVTVSKGKAKNVTDNDIDTTWTGGKMTITMPKNKTPDGILIKWHLTKNDYTFKSYDKNGKVLNKYTGKSFGKIHNYYKLNKNTVKVTINLKKEKGNNGICTLRVYEKGKVGPSVEQWQTPKAKNCDLMVISAHRDDELLFFGGTIPYYNNVRHKNVYTMYMSGTDRLRVREALAGQWSMGVKTYPIFMGYIGGYHKGVSGTLNDWGGEDAVLGKMVEKIREYRPDVIVTHDKDGEYGHPTHKTTSYLVTKAVKLAKDKTKYKSSYKKYGAWKVKKVYCHYTNTNPITMNWSKHYSQLDGKSPIQVATVAFDKHRSQHGGWDMNNSTVKKYSNKKFGLMYTTVGKDKKKNDFFEHIK